MADASSLGFSGSRFLCVQFRNDILMQAKQILLELAETLPAEATLADAIQALKFRQAVLEGPASADRGDGIPLSEARKFIKGWISEPSGPRSL